MVLYILQDLIQQLLVQSFKHFNFGLIRPKPETKHDKHTKIMGMNFIKIEIK